MPYFLVPLAFGAPRPPPHTSLSLAHAVLIDPDAGLGVVRFSGSLSAREIREAMRDVFEDERWRPGFDTLWDGRSVLSYEIDPDDPAQTAPLVEYFRERGGGGRAAVLAEGHMAYTSVFMGRLYTVTDQARMVGVFWSVEEALAWLGIRERPASVADL